MLVVNEVESNVIGLLLFKIVVVRAIAEEAGRI